MIVIGFEAGCNLTFSWKKLKERRDASIKRLNDIYVNNLDGSGVTHFNKFAKFIGKTEKGFQIQVKSHYRLVYVFCWE